MASSRTGAFPHLIRTVADWQSLDAERPHELIDGDLIVTPPPSTGHQRAAFRVALLLNQLIADRDAGEVFIAPTGLRLSETTVLEPDVMLVLDEDACTVEPAYVDGTPSLVVEVLSPGTVKRDTTEKRRIYENARVRELWFVDPTRQTLTILSLIDQRFVASGPFSRDDQPRSAILDTLIDVGSLFRRR